MTKAESIKRIKAATEYALTAERDVAMGRIAVAAGDMPQYVLDARVEVAEAARKDADRAWQLLVATMGRGW